MKFKTGFVCRWISFVPDPQTSFEKCCNNLLSRKMNLWNNGDIHINPIKQLIHKSKLSKTHSSKNQNTLFNSCSKKLYTHFQSFHIPGVGN